MPANVNNIKTLNILKESVISGISKGIRIGGKILSIMIPISLLVMVLQETGIIEKIAPVLAPVAKIIGLQSSSILALVTGMLVNCYSAIAVMIPLNLSGKELTICSLMILICHTLPIEVPIQKKTGAPGISILLFRIGSCLLAGFILNRILPESYTSAKAVLESPAAQNASFNIASMLARWGHSSIISIVKILVMVSLFMIVHEMLERFRFIDKISAASAGLMKILGLSPDHAVSWLMVNIFGLIYGSGIIQAEQEKRTFSREDNTALHLSIAVSHALIQETIIFVAIGASALWLILPRMFIAFLAVWAFRLISLFLRK